MNAITGKPVEDRILLAIRGLERHFHKQQSMMDTLLRRPPQIVRALNGIDLDVRAGETLGIVGESGCGKSTLARCIVGLHLPDRGTITFEGTDVTTLKGAARREYNRHVQMMFQDPYTSLNPRKTVRATLEEGLRVHRMRPEREIPGRVEELLDLVRLPRGAAEKFPHEFSGGQRQRVAIARALSVEPTCLVADELVSALDVSVQAQVVNLLLELQNELSLTILFVAHDLRLVRHVSHRVAVIYLGAIVELGPSESLFSAPAHPYSQALLAAAPSIDPTQTRDAPAISGELPSPLNIPPGCPFHLRCPHANEQCRTQKPTLRPFRDGEVACHHAERLSSSRP